MGLATPPAECLRTRPERCCCGQEQSANEYSWSWVSFCRTPKKQNRLIFYGSVFFNHGPAISLHTLPHLARPTVNDTYHRASAKKFSYGVCVHRARRTGIGAVSIERGGQM